MKNKVVLFFKKISLLAVFFIGLLITGFNYSANGQVTVALPSSFATLDASDGSTDGFFTVNGDLTITPSGSINGSGAGSGHLKINVLNGDLIMGIGAKISGNVTTTNKVGDAITVWARDILLQGNGTNGAAITSNQPTGASCNGGKGGNIYLNASRNIIVAFGAVITANASCSAGDIEIKAPAGEIRMDGLVQSRSTLSGIPNQPPSGGPIWISADCLLEIRDNGIVSSEGGDGGADLVHLDACQVVVWGLVQSTGFGHSVPVNPVTSLVPPFRDDKPGNSTAGVEVWGSTIVINKVAPHKGEINANLPLGAGSRAWIDILAGSNIAIVGAATGTFAVHSNIGGNNGMGGIITVKSLGGAVSATGQAIQSNGIGSGNRRGGPVTVESNNNMNLEGAKIEAKGVNAGGTVSLRSYNGTISDATTIYTVTNGGTVNKTACPVTCGGSPSLTSQPYVVLPDADCSLTSCLEENVCPCINCDGDVVTISSSYTLNLNGAVPAALQGFVTFVKPAGTTPDKWKAVFNLGAKKFVLQSPAVIKTTVINGSAPGIEINTTCEVVVEKGAAIRVETFNKNGGDIVIYSHGTVSVDGELTNKVTSTLGLPGAIKVTSLCGDLGVTGLVQIIGTDGGGNTISLVTCKSDCVPPPYAGDITISGLVKSVAAAHAGDLTLNRPDIRVVSMNGRVFVNANTVDPLYDDFSFGGGRYDIYGGLLSWVTTNVPPGKITVQAWSDVVVRGHGIDPSGSVYTSFGAIAAVGAGTSSMPGGIIDVRSLNGKVSGTDRAFDVRGRNRLAFNYAKISLQAKGDISFSRALPGTDANFNPVMNASGVGTGDKGGTNDLRSYAGSINIGDNVVVTAAVPSGTQGFNNLTSALGLSISASATVTPNPTVVSDNTVPAPDALYTNCPDIDASGVQSRGVPVAKTAIQVTESTPKLFSFPNPIYNATTLSYTLTNPGYVSLKIFNIAGKEVGVLVAEKQTPGHYSYKWNAAGMPAGVYYARIQAGKFSATNKLVVAK